MPQKYLFIFRAEVIVFIHMPYNIEDRDVVKIPMFTCQEATDRI